MKKFIPNALLLVATTIVGVLAMELGLRVLHPISFMHVETQEADEVGGIVPDRDLGWRPALGTNEYDASGILLSRSIYPKVKGAPKVLLIGDSVTARGQIVSGLANLMPPETAFLNAGIEGYNIEQEIEFFFRYQTSLNPDVIIHQMHINDLHASRYLKRERGGKLRLYSPRVSETNVNPTLYRYSQIYRFVVTNFGSRYTKDELKTAAANSLHRMRGYTRQNGIRYHLVLFPMLEPLASWSAYDRETRDYILRVGEELELDVVDLQPVSERLIAAGVDPKQDAKDILHPSHPMGEAAAKYIVERIPSLLDLPRVGMIR